jgi:hypothetical protein
MKILKVDYFAKVHFFWTVLLFVVGYQLNHSYGNYIAENNLYDLEFSRAGIAGVRMAAVYFLMCLLHRQINLVATLAAAFFMYFTFELYPIAFKGEGIDYWRFFYLGLAGATIWIGYLPFQKKHQVDSSLTVHNA